MLSEFANPYEQRQYKMLEAAGNGASGNRIYSKVHTEPGVADVSRVDKFDGEGTYPLKRSILL